MKTGEKRCAITPRKAASGQDRYGRTLGVVILPNGINLNQELLRRGFAWWFRKYSGQKSFALLHQALTEGNLYAIAQVVLHGKEQLVVVRPVEAHDHAAIHQVEAYRGRIQRGGLLGMRTSVRRSMGSRRGLSAESPSIAGSLIPCRSDTARRRHRMPGTGRPRLCNLADDRRGHVV